ncbi:MAG: S-methyl-5-thioribose-1-phosphate isomerase [Bacteriovoracaceae bacterium]|nr:S-methyl-5-thioribose-1-phosphate isomerase [Bacteriovoracaceae bacterium]
MKLPISVEWKKDHLQLLDQTLLPTQTLFFRCDTAQDVWQAIKSLRVRGAPAIGIAGAFGFYLGMIPFEKLSMSEFLLKAKEVFQYLNSSRPTAVNLQWALSRQLTLIQNFQSTGTDKTQTTKELLQKILQEALNIQEEDRSICYRIGINALPLIKEGMGILTHCNPGAIAVSEWGTALAPLHMAKQQGINFKVYVDETRPLLQGGRLTTWELMQSGIDCTLITDSMAAMVMSQGKVQMVIVGTDRVVANGDMANKIGTMNLAILAKHFKIPFYVACPSSTFDFSTTCGSDIEIEERPSSEITHFKGQLVAPEDVKVYNPAFDVTPCELITGMVTENGIYSYPYIEKIKDDFRQSNS